MITLQNVTKEYQKGSIGLDNVSLEVDKGEFAFIVGKSGSGKTTLIKLLLKELEATSGDIVVNGYHYQKMKRRQIPYLRRQIGVVFQDFRLLRDRSIYENVAFAQQVIEVPKRAMKRQVQNVLELVGLGTGSGLCLTNCQEVSSRGLPLPGLWSITRRFCWQMNLRGIWTRRMHRRSWIFWWKSRREERQ